MKPFKYGIASIIIFQDVFIDKVGSTLTYSREARRLFIWIPTKRPLRCTRYTSGLVEGVQLIAV